MPTIRVAPDEVLTVTAPANGYGTVRQDGSNHHWHVGATSPLKLAPGLYFIDDHLTCNATNLVAAVLETTLPRATQIVRSQRILTMALADKMKHLAARAKAVPASLDAVADKHLARLDALEARGTDSFGKLGDVLDGVESGIVAAEDALNQLTNGAPSGDLPN